MVHEFLKVEGNAAAMEAALDKHPVITDPPPE